MKIIAGSSNTALAQSIAKHLDSELISVEISKFANDEKRVWINDSVKGQNVALVQSFSQPVDEHIMEFLLMADALERLGARHINLILPWMGYSLQDKVFRDGEAIAAKVVANLVSTAHIKRVFLMDVHNSSTPGFFSIPTHHLSALDMFVEYVKATFPIEECVVASPDFGGIKRSRVFANQLGLDMVNIDKHRDLASGEVTAVGLAGDVTNKIVLINDDCILSGGTIIEAAELLKERGAKEVHFLATHGLFVNGAVDRLEKSQADSIIITDTIAQPKQSKKIKVLSVAPLLAESLKAWA